MHIVKTFMDIKQLENNNALPAAIIKTLKQDLVGVIDNMQQLGYFYDPDNDGYAVILEPCDDIHDLSNVGLNPKDGGLLGAIPELIKEIITGTEIWYKVGILYNNQCLMTFYITPELIDNELIKWLQRNI